MSDFELNKLIENLWRSADMLRSRAHLSSTAYDEPILGLIFLRYADIMYKQHKDIIVSKYETLKGTIRERVLKKQLAELA